MVFPPLGQYHFSPSAATYVFKRVSSSGSITILFERVYVVVLYVAGLSLCLSSREVVGISRLLNLSRIMFREVVAVDETVVKNNDKPSIIGVLGIRGRLKYVHETFGERNGIERFFRELKDRTKRLYNNINTEMVRSIEEIATTNTQPKT